MAWMSVLGKEDACWRSSEGSNIGILGYLSQSNDNANCVPVNDRYKFMDDLTILEVVYLVNVGIASYNIRNHIASDIPLHNQIISCEKLKTQEYLNEIETWTNRKKMVLNEKKTKCMVFNRSKKFQFTTDIKLKQKRLDIVDETKLLGVIITNDLRWNRNTEVLVKNANAKMRMLQVASKFIKSKNDLLHIYKTFLEADWNLHQLSGIVV